MLVTQLVYKNNNKYGGERLETKILNLSIDVIKKITISLLS